MSGQYGPVSGSDRHGTHENSSSSEEPSVPSQSSTFIPVIPGPSPVPTQQQQHQHDTTRDTRISLETVGSGSDIVYRDNLDEEPFDEKETENRYRDERGAEYADEDGIGFPVEPTRLRPRKKSRKILAVLIVIIVTAAAVGVLAASGYSAPSFAIKSGNRHITMDHIFNGTFSPEWKQLDWVGEAEDGTFSHVNTEGNIVLATVKDPNNTVTLVEASAVQDPRGGQLKWDSWKLSADMEYVLFKTDYVKQWRHSSFGNYFIHRLSDSATFAVIPPTTRPTISYAAWSPISHSLAFVSGNDLYVLPASQLASGNPVPIRVTTDGSAVVFNGVPDWVYEEEVFSTDSALWWSPNAQTIAYLRSDETAVKDYKLQYYNPTDDAFSINQYPTELDMKYPKPGTPNPLATVYTFSLSSYEVTKSVSTSKQRLHWAGEMPIADRIIVEVGWVADDGLIVKEIDRAARSGHVIVFQNGEDEGAVVRALGKDGEEGDDGWIDHGQNVIPVKGSVEGYLDLIPNKAGYQHIAFFHPINATNPIWLTSGEWEVTDLSGVDVEQGVIYFVAANPSIDRHLYSVPLPTAATLAEYEPEVTAMTDTAKPGYYDVHFSPGAGYYILAYRGPDIPWERLVQTGEDGINLLMEGNDALNQTLSEFVRPILTRSTLNIDDDYELNMIEIVPPSIDTTGRKKYPVLIQVYGGPYSQMVSNTFQRDWHSYLACEKKYIIVRVDGRGTGYKGRSLRNPIVDDLGHWEVQDQLAAAREMIKRKYVDRSRIGIWGWSYGGYMTLKTLEADSGLFTLGMAVAPVTNWLYYDSVYTERYMNTPEANPDGYIRSAVNNVTAFDDVDLLLAHGTGDDNVHFAHMASLVDKLTQEKVRGWRFRMFTDSAHAMEKRGAYRELYEWMTSFLEEKWGRGGTVHH